MVECLADIRDRVRADVPDIDARVEAAFVDMAARG